MNQPIHFAQIREDSWVEKYLVDKFKPQKIICIGSGGCTAFSLLSDDVGKVICVDNNSSQFNLIQTKKLGMRFLDRENFLELLGEESKSEKKRKDIIQDLINLEINKSLSEFIINNKEIEIYGLNHCGSTEKFYRFISKNLKSIIPDIENVFNLNRPEDYDEFFKQNIDNEVWSTAIKILLSKTSHLLFFPEFMFAKSSENDFSQYFNKQFVTEFKKHSMSNNYFFSQLISQKYLFDIKEGGPPYLQASGYIETKRNLDKLLVSDDSILDVIAKNESIDAFFLSNVFDWLTPDQIDLACKAILNSSSRGSIILYRNLFSSTPLPKFFLDCFIIDENLSSDMLKKERSMMYRSVTVGVRR